MKAELLRQIQDSLSTQQDVLRRLKSREIQLKQVPEALFLPRGTDQLTVETERAWTEHMPPVILCSFSFDQTLESRQKRKFDSMISRQQAEALSLPTDGTIVLPAGKYLSVVSEAQLRFAPSLELAKQWLAENDYHVTGDIYSLLYLVLKHADGTRWGVHENLIPVAENKK